MPLGKHSPVYHFAADNKRLGIGEKLPDVGGTKLKGLFKICGIGHMSLSFIEIEEKSRPASTTILHCKTKHQVFQGRNVIIQRQNPDRIHFALAIMRRTDDTIT
jgi:hypothetical protein